MINSSIWRDASGCAQLTEQVDRMLDDPAL